MIKLIFTILFCYIVIASYAQYLGPTDWENEEDFRLVEDKIIEDILWLEENPFATEINDTKAITEYVLEWLKYAPYISVTLDEVFTESITRNKKYKYGDKFLVTYLFGKSVYTLQNPDDGSEVNAAARGVEGMIKVYIELLRTDSKAFNRSLEYYRSLYERGGLTDYVREQFEKRGIGNP